MRSEILLGGLTASLFLLGCAAGPIPVAQRISASLETVPVVSKEDAADDPAIWVNPADPARSLIIGTNKNQSAGGLDIYRLDGSLFARVSDPGLNNVDLRQRVVFGSDTMDLVAATRRTDSTLAIYQIDTAGVLKKMETLPVKLMDPYGMCMGVLPGSTDVYVVVTGKTGLVQRWKLVRAGSGFSALALRDLKVSTQVEGCVVDDSTGSLFVGEEDRGVHRFALSPDSSDKSVLVDTVRGGQLLDDVEGMAIYTKPAGEGFLVVSSQGSNSYAVYDRLAPWTYRGSVTLVDSAGVDGTNDTDGIEVNSAALGPNFPEGILVVQDGDNSPQTQNFKYVNWRKVAGALQLKSRSTKP